MISTFAHFGYNLPKRETFDLIRQAGFDGVSLWWDDDFGDLNYRENPDLVRNAGLSVENIHAPFGGANGFWTDGLDGDALTEIYIKIAAECAEYGIQAMVLHLSGGDAPPTFNETGLERIRRIVDKAERCGVNAAFENLRKAGNGHFEYVLDNIASPRAGFCYDSGHHNCRTPDIDLLGKYGSRLMTLHLHDNGGYTDGASGEDQHKLPFDGTVDWPETMRTIAETGYRGAVALEAQNRGYEDLPPDEFLRLAFERGRRLEGLYLDNL